MSSSTKSSQSPSSSQSMFFTSAPLIFILGLLLRLILLVYGIYQDTHSALKYTDIDYYVFTDAARLVSRSQSPYSRATYRYTPLLAWLLYPTSFSGKDGLFWFHSGKALFALSDLVAGWFILDLLRRRGLRKDTALKYASVWLLNPMVANISTRGSSEGLLCAMVVTTLWAFETGWVGLAGAMLGVCVHFKIYPFIYGASMFWALESAGVATSGINAVVKDLLNSQRLKFLLTSLAAFMGFNLLMYSMYGQPFLQHTFFHHFTRIDHRHNFSPYNTLLYLTSVPTSSADAAQSSFLRPERFAFLPQLLLSTLVLPLALARKSLSTTLFAQTLAFVTFNKVCTSQYFLWYLIFLPLYLPGSSMVARPMKGLLALGLWVAGQAVWLGFGYGLEMLGKSTFVPGLWLASLGFFMINCWILGIVVDDGLEKQEMVQIPATKSASVTVSKKSE